MYGWVCVISNCTGVIGGRATVIDRGVGRDLVRYALITRPGEHRGAARDDIAGRESLHDLHFCWRSGLRGCRSPPGDNDTESSIRRRRSEG